MSETQGNGKVNLRGALKVVKKSGNYLTPVFEAFTNSLEAIKLKSPKVRKIEIVLDFKGVNDIREFISISIRDNGIGFDSTNLKRFMELFDESKGMGNKGSGRLQLVHRFNSVKYESCYLEDRKFYVRHFAYGVDHGEDFIGDTLFSNENTGAKDTYTVLVLSGLKHQHDRRLYSELSASKLRAAIVSHYIVHLKNEKPDVTIRVVVNGKEEAAEKIGEIPNPSNNTKFLILSQKPRVESGGHVTWEPVKSYELVATNYEFSKTELEMNKIALFSKGVEVTTLTFPDVITARSEIGGKHYLTAITGSLFDDPKFVNSSRTEFDCPKKGVIEEEIKHSGAGLYEEDYVFFETIKEGIKQNLEHFYPELKKLKEEQGQDIDKVAKTFCISSETVKGTSFDLGDDSDEKILAKLYVTEGRRMARSDAKIKELYDTVSKLNPSSDTYAEEIDEKSKELVSLIPKQNTILLGKYVARREFVAKLLKLIIDGETAIQKEWKTSGQRQSSEGLIHDLIFLRKSDASEGLNDLWILNEEYVHFSGCSDLPLKDIEIHGKKVFLHDAEEEHTWVKFGFKKRMDKRPDIFLFPGEGKCVIVEFKAPDVDLSDCLNQIPKYARLLANSTNPDFQFKQIYGYLLGENIKDIDMPGGYLVNVSNDSWFKPIESVRDIANPEITRASLYMEVVKLSEIQNRALLRNKSFADKLGIRL